METEYGYRGAGSGARTSTGRVGEWKPSTGDIMTEEGLHCDSGQARAPNCDSGQARAPNSDSGQARAPNCDSGQARAPNCDSGLI